MVIFKINNMLKKVSVLFDYLYYRLGKLYFKTEGKSTLAPVYIIALSEILIFMDIMFCIYLIFCNRSVSKTFVHQYLHQIELLYAIAFVLLTMYNYKRYKNKYELFREKWQGESKSTKVVKGLLIVSFLIFIISFIGIFYRLLD